MLAKLTASLKLAIVILFVAAFITMVFFITPDTILDVSAIQ